MKYLKRFFESFEENVLQDFCETHLAYLLDDGYELYIGDDHGKKTISITIPSDVSNEDGEYDNNEQEEEYGAYEEERGDDSDVE